MLDGTFALLEETRAYWTALPPRSKTANDSGFCTFFLPTRCSGRLGRMIRPFSETTTLPAPNSPYGRVQSRVPITSVRAYHHNLRAAGAHHELLE